MVLFPHCKINLGLFVLGKRNDGYHDISTCFYPIGWKDALEIIPGPSNNISIGLSGIQIPGIPDNNLCVEAVKLVKKDFDLPGIRIHLHKSIPAGAGLGGGSSDAAFTLQILDRMFHLYLDEEILTWYSSMLGSDCSFFLCDKPRLASGRGEVLSDIRIDLTGKTVVLVYPGFSINSASAYEQIKPQDRKTSIKEIIEYQPISTWKNELVNDFEKVVFGRYPELESIKKSFYDQGACFASMSGSGSCIYGIFNEYPREPFQFPAHYQIWTGLL
ncbi:MAG TPA: 4-(cytidine 5'-diphospho)-2-C-methyl-D-erythritol kinase [Cyclobacteriaceae bacterium]|nr:4-(cytidine 5'-diphospho)-2-C-methyl-D-erythritol kinase [Cyclobacteriaceae bacterium]